MSEAIFGLLGVLLGGIITAGSAYLLDRRRERADREREIRNHAIELKRAARLIDFELLRAQSAASICVEKRRWWSGDVSPLSTEAWQKNSSIIAPHLSDQAWGGVTTAVEAVDHIAQARELAFELGQVAEAVSDGTSERIAPMLRDLKLGRGAIAPFVRDVQPASGQAISFSQQRDQA